MLSLFLVFCGYIATISALEVCGKARTGVLFGCDILDYNIPGEPNTCYTPDDLIDLDPDATCSVIWSCNCADKQLVISIYNSANGCDDKRSDNPLTADGRCYDFDTCRGNVQAKLDEDEFNKCCDCASGTSNFINQ